MRQVITTDFGQVKVGDTVLPGNMQEMEIEGGVRNDEMEVPGTSGTSKQPQGFQDATIYLKLLLPTDEESTCYDKLKVIVGILQKTDKAAKPYIYNIVNKHTALWNIKEVIFETLRSQEDNLTDSIRAALTFREYRPVVVKREQRRPVEEILTSEDILPAEDYGLYDDFSIGSYVQLQLTPGVDDDPLGYGY